MSRKKRSAATLAGIATLASIPVAAAHGDARSILGAVNYERQMAGIDSVTVNKSLESGCVQHALYMNQNNILTHGEDASAAGYTATGAYMGTKAVLARNTAGFTSNPWKFAPFHEFQVLHPWLQQTGIGVSGSYACMVTLGDRPGGMLDDIKLITAPGTGQFIRPAEIARESPFTPGEELGLPQGTKTGPHIYVYAVGPQRFPDVVIRSATLTSSDGVEAPVRWVDGDSPRSGRYLDGGAILIPTSPLKEGVAYGLRIEAQTTSSSGQTVVISRTTSFTTGPDESALAETPETSDSVTASSNRPSTAPSTSPSSPTKPTVIGEDGQAKLAVAVAWNKRRTGLRVRIQCQSATVRCEGPLRVLVRKRGNKLGKLRFKARKGPLNVSLAPGKQIVRRISLEPVQQHHGKKRGFSVRWGGGTPIRVTAKK